MAKRSNINNINNKKLKTNSFIKPTNPPPFNSLGLFTFLRTYARRHDENDINSTIESWEECITRIVKSCNSQLSCDFNNFELQELFNLLYNLKCSVAGRFMWQLGTKTVDNLGLMSLQNCCFVKVDTPIKPFVWTMNFLMLGAGVGYRILPEDIEKLPIVKSVNITRTDTSDADFIVPDSREGWLKLLSKILKAHFYSGISFTYSCILLRSKGAPIKGFGGTASGPDVFCEGLSKISIIINNREGQKLRSVDCLDIMNIIGSVVVAGNVRRSAQIALGDCRDIDYMRAKRWDLGNIPNHRAMSNNSVICNDIEDILINDEFWAGYNGNGEPYGLINLNLMKSCGRVGDYRYNDPDVEGINPCAEQLLCNYETCCLGELYLPNINTKEELFTCVKYIYVICKNSLRLPCTDSIETQNIVHKNMRMGIGITGYLQSTEEQKNWLPDCYEYLRNYDVEYSRIKGFPTSIKLTTVKPSGTLSLLAGCTAGIHPGYSQYYIRRIRISSVSPLIELAKKHGYHIEWVKNFDGTNDHTTKVISFPYSLPANTIFANNCTAVQQLEYVKEIQRNWSDNSVSCTVTYKTEELCEIKEWLKINYNTCIKSVSFLLYSGHGFIQAPIEPITKEVYEQMISNCTEISNVEGICFTANDDKVGDGECTSGVCPIR